MSLKTDLYLANFCEIMILFSFVTHVMIIWKGIEGPPEMDYIIHYLMWKVHFFISCQHALQLKVLLHRVLSNFSVDILIMGGVCKNT